MKLKSNQLLLVVTLLLISSWAQAAITCSVSSPGFTSAYNPALATKNITQTYLIVTCQRNLAGDPTTQTYSVSNNNGLWVSGNQNRAKLTTAVTYVNYDLYTDSLCTTLWRNTPTAKRLPAPTGSGTMTLSGLTPTLVNINYWGCIPALQAALPAGIYSDTVSMSLIYGTSTATGGISIAIFMSAACTLATPPGNVAFSYTSLSVTPATASTAFGINCTSLLPYTMALDATAGTVIGLNYTLALSAAGGTGTGLLQTYAINGSMVAGQAGTCAAASCSGSQPRVLTITY